MKFGIKIPFDIFCNEMSETSHMLCDSFGGRDKLLGFLSREVDAAELGIVRHNADGGTLKEAVSICNSYGLSVTIHGSVNGIDDANEFFESYVLLFESGLQPLYNITVHPFKNPKDTQKILTSICEHIDAMKYPVRITLENQRYANETFKHTLCNDVTEVVKRMNNQHLYVCFDFGHQLSNVHTKGEDFDKFGDEFLSLVKHTHIHSLFEGVTHFPLNCGETALEHNLTGLMRHKYDGIFLLELDPGRYCDRFPIKDSIISSISILKAAAFGLKEKIR